MEAKILESENAQLLSEVLEGLSKEQKQLPSKLFYDERGSQLFDDICELDEYYPTRTEIKIMSDNIEEIVSQIGEESLLVELGSGSSTKIRLLIEHLESLAAYVPVDISAEHLHKAADCLKSDYPQLNIFPLAADYTEDFSLPEIPKQYSSIDAFYPGSTIGNFTPEEAKTFLKRIANTCGKGSGLLIGVDLIKDKSILHAAYNDKKNVTAEFNLNMLKHINDLFDADFDRNKFKHHAFFNERHCRIEMHLISTENQIVHIEEHEFKFEKDETILTEYSYKYSLQSFAELVEGIYDVEKVWVDDNKLFSVQFLRAV